MSEAPSLTDKGFAQHLERDNGGVNIERIDPHEEAKLKRKIDLRILVSVPQMPESSNECASPLSGSCFCSPISTAVTSETLTQEA